MLLDKRNLAVKEVCLKETETKRTGYTGIWLTPRGTIATDGYIMIRAEYPSAFDEDEFPLNGTAVKPAASNDTPLFIPAKDAKRILDELKRIKSSQPILSTALVGKPDEERETVPIVITDLERTQILKLRQPGEEPFNFDAAFEGLEEPVFKIAINVGVLEKLLRAVKEAVGTSEYRTRYIFFGFFGLEKPVYFRVKTGDYDDQYLDGLLMPARADWSKFGKPKPWEEEAEKKEENEAQGAEPDEPVQESIENVPETCEICGTRAQLTRIGEDGDCIWVCPECAVQFEDLQMQVSAA